MKKDNPRDMIISSLVNKLPVKSEAHQNATACFEIVKRELKALADEMCEAAKGEKAVQVKYREKGAFQCELSFGEDIVIFYLYADVFDLDPNHPNWKTSYLKEDRNKAFCGMIGIYNFLTNSFRLNRLDDVGYMIGRIFINHENHFFCEGKRQLGFLYNDFLHATVTEKSVRQVIESAVLYCADFDLMSPPFNDVIQIRVGDMQKQNQRSTLQTGKRMGFRFEADTDQIE